MPDDTLQRIRERARQDAAFRQQLVTTPLAALSGYDLTEAERLQVVLPNFSWLIEGELAGASRPQTDDALAVLRAAGIRALLSLSEQPLPGELLEKHGLQAEHLPIADFTAPTIPQAEQAVVAIHRFRDAGLPVAVHCGAGLGRTGTILACYLVWQGMPAEDAIATVRARRPGSVETPEQEAVVARYDRQQRRATSS
ncbi:MAG: dual specificity protein phosphatase family protein [Chloroflexota bacterium]